MKIRTKIQIWQLRKKKDMTVISLSFWSKLVKNHSNQIKYITWVRFSLYNN